MVKLIKEAVLAGLGFEAKAREVWDELVRRGEENSKVYAKRVKEGMGRLEKDLKGLEKKERHLVDRVMAKFPMASKADLERLEKRIQELSTKLGQS